MSIVAEFFSLRPGSPPVAGLVDLRMVQPSVLLQAVFVQVGFVAQTAREVPVVVVHVRLVARQLTLAVAPGATVLADVLLLLCVVLFNVILEEQFTEESLGAYFALVVQLLCVLCGNVSLEEVE